jgi:[FeFe] hydrogenase H-cluster maturation GTPase HydF
MSEYRENKPHIAFFGRCNVGKSTLINTLTGQSVAITSSLKGTTTDAVKKTIELFGIGACVLIDTAGLDDSTTLGEKRKEKTLEIISLIDLAIIVISDNIFSTDETKLIDTLKDRNIPYVIVYNKQDIFPINQNTQKLIQEHTKDFAIVSKTDEKAKEKINTLIKNNLSTTPYNNNGILQGIVSERDIVLLVTPIDSSAPKGRMILPQVKMIREVLDNNAINIVVKPEQLEYTLEKITPNLVITDSQVFSFVDKVLSKNIKLTSFSILLAKEKGAFEDYLKGTPMIDNLQDGDNILLLENCTHQPTCEDIGRVKLPNMLRKYTNKELNFKVLAGTTEMVKDIHSYALVIQCGGCVATPKQIINRLEPFRKANIPITNYGMAIAYVNGIFNRACEIF